MSLFRSIALLLAMAFAANGCAFLGQDRIHYRISENDNYLCENCAPLTNQDEFIGLALSGGGARASVFGASAMEVLAEAGLMNRVTHISSVSGGGFPATYYALHSPQPCSNAQNDSASPCTSESYAEFKQMMRKNYLNLLTFRQLKHISRISSPTRRLSSLQNVLDEQFIHNAQFEDLPPSPVLMLNAARYDDARRFVFSNQAIPDIASSIEPYSEQTLRTASFSMPDCTRAVPKDFSLALAVAISAGFPPLLGPASIATPSDCDGGDIYYWHLGDGGILENTGVETLEDYALRANPDAPRPKNVFIFSIDAGKSTAPDEMMKQRNLKLWTTDPGRVVEIVGRRAEAYRRVVSKRPADANGFSFPNSETVFHIVKMRYTDAQLTQWPESCGKRDGGSQVIRAQLFNIPTNFKITPCDADLIEMAARDVVSRTLLEQQAILNEAGLVW